MNITKITAFTPLKLVLCVHAMARNDTPAASINVLPSHEYSSHCAGVSLPVGRFFTGGSGFLSRSSMTMSSSVGLRKASTIGVATSITIVGTMLNAVNTVLLNGNTCPVSFSTTFMALPCVAWASAIELEMPLAHTTQPEKPAATIHAKSTRMRLATSRASSAATTRPKPQLKNDASATDTNVSVAAWTGVRARETTARKSRCTGGACANAWPVTRISVIWNANVRISKKPLYQPPTIPMNDACGANNADTTATNAVIRMARTNGSGMTRSKRSMVALVKRVLPLPPEGEALAGFMSVSLSLLLDVLASGGVRSHITWRDYRRESRGVVQGLLPNAKVGRTARYRWACRPPIPLYAASRCPIPAARARHRPMRGSGFQVLSKYYASCGAA